MLERIIFKIKSMLPNLWLPPNHEVKKITKIQPQPKLLVDQRWSTHGKARESQHFPQRNICHWSRNEEHCIYSSRLLAIKEKSLRSTRLCGWCGVGPAADLSALQIDIFFRFYGCHFSWVESIRDFTGILAKRVVHWWRPPRIATWTHFSERFILKLFVCSFVFHGKNWLEFYHNEISSKNWV